MTLIITDKVYFHTVENNSILPFEKKGRRREARGHKDHLLLDKTYFRAGKEK